MLNLIAILVVLSFLLGTVRCDAEVCKAIENKPWSYDNNLANGPDHWGDTYSDCNGDNQSPIDIQTEDVQSKEDSDGLQLTNYEQPISKVIVKNLGDTVKIIPNDDVKRSITVDGNSYDLKAFIIHWGNKSTNEDGEAVATPGSNHKIDGKQYDMEIQLLHRNDSDDIIILSILFDQASDSNPAIEAIQKPIDKYQYQDDEYDGDLNADYSTGINLTEFVHNGAPYFQYNGSLVDPPCTEDITRLVVKDPSSVSTTQLLDFQGLYAVKKDDVGEDESNSCHIINNFKPTQPLNDRKVLSG